MQTGLMLRDAKTAKRSECGPIICSYIASQKAAEHFICIHLIKVNWWMS